MELLTSLKFQIVAKYSHDMYTKGKNMINLVEFGSTKSLHKL